MNRVSVDPTEIMTKFWRAVNLAICRVFVAPSASTPLPQCIRMWIQNSNVLEIIRVCNLICLSGMNKE